MKQKYVIINDDKGNFRIVKKQSFRDVIIKSNENWSEISEENLIKFQKQINEKFKKQKNIKIKEVGINEIAIEIKIDNKKYSGCLTEVE